MIAIIAKRLNMKNMIAEVIVAGVLALCTYGYFLYRGYI